MFASLTTVDHRRTSSLMRAVNSSAVLPIGVAAKAFIRALKSSVAVICRQAASSFPAIGVGMPAGPIKARYVPPTTSATPASASVGISGSSGMRAVVVTARAPHRASITARGASDQSISRRSTNHGVACRSAHVLSLVNQVAVADQRCPNARTNSTATKLAIPTQGRRIVMSPFALQQSQAICGRRCYRLGHLWQRALTSSPASKRPCAIRL
jgi:hypothetical protein